MSSPVGVQSAWRQLVDLIGRRRVPATPEAIERLRAIRAQVPPPVRAASARALAFATPPAALVRLFAEDELSIAAPVLRIARLMPNEWVAILPAMPSANRSILRHRRDLGPTVTRALETYGPSDFVLPPVELTPEPQPAVEVAEAASPNEQAPAEAETAVESAVHDGGEQAPVALVAQEPSEDQPDAAPEAAEPPAAPAPVLSIDWREVLAARPPLPIDTPAPPQAQPAPLAEAPQAPPVASQPTPQPGDGAVVAVRSFRVAAPRSFGLGSIVARSDIFPTERGDGSEATEPAAEAAPTPAKEQLATAPPVAENDALVALAGVALGGVAVPELGRIVAEPKPSADQPLVEVPTAPTEPTPPTTGEGVFQIADIVARIDAFQRDRDEPDGLPANDVAQELDEAQAEHFSFETDARGVVRWVAGVARAALIGMPLDGTQSLGAQVDGSATGAFRRRAGFANARLVVDGLSSAAGQWRISGIPVFDRATGRFTGYRGTARRPRVDESAEPVRHRTPSTDAVRQLVHELRTPTTAIAGFAEMIEGELLGPVPAPYRDYAGNIRHQARGLLGAIDDLDTAARLDSNALDLRPESVDLAPMLAQVVEDLRPLATLRRVQISLFAEPGIKVEGDERAVERLAGRLIATMVAAGGADETVMITAAREGIDTVTLMVDRPKALAGFEGDALLSADADLGEDSGAPLLGTGFALRLVRNLATELGGALVIAADRLTLRLPAAVRLGMGQATTN
ncbi:histidine kinase dimerization/phospho-acceptor domain-containing protein [Sphingomonas sp. GlSt437]